jgi:hypothetical protein
MKKIAWMVGGAMALAMAWPQACLAGGRGNEGWAALGGFVGGLIVGNSRCAPPPACYYPPPVVYTPVVVERPVIIERPVETGYYRYEERQVWEPGRWVYERDYCGNRIRTWVPGCYRTVQVKTWVPGCPPRRYAGCDTGRW